MNFEHIKYKLQPEKEIAAKTHNHIEVGGKKITDGHIIHKDEEERKGKQ